MKPAEQRVAAAASHAYVVLARTLIEEIAAEDYRVGDRLPTEEQLAGRYGVSRSTVRAALAELEERGMVDRRPRIGTVIRAKHPQSRYQVSVGSLGELLVFLGSTVVMPRRVIPIIADRAVAEDLRCAPGEQWIKVQTLRTPAGGSIPISWTDYYLRPRFRTVVDQLGRKPGPVYPILEKRFGVSIDSIEQDIGACALPAGVARELKSTARAPALRVIHRMLSVKDGTLYCTVSLYPADRFRYVQTLKRA